jgi:hypothetical protein
MIKNLKILNQFNKFEYNIASKERFLGIWMYKKNNISPFHELRLKNFTCFIKI